MKRIIFICLTVSLAWTDAAVSVDDLLIKNKCEDSSCWKTGNNTSTLNHVKSSNRSPGSVGDDTFSQKVECTEDSLCPEDRACVAEKCVNPCLYVTQGPDNTFCHVTHHKATHYCLPGFIGDPSVGCRVECQDNKDCALSKSCTSQKCVDHCEMYKKNNTICQTVEHKTYYTCVQGFIGDPYIGCVDKYTEPKGYSHTDGQYFLFTDSWLSWSKSLELCARNGLRGATFGSRRDYDKLVKLIRRSSYEVFWVAASDLGEAGKYVWAPTGHPINYGKWAINEPSHRENDGETEHCVYISAYTNYRMEDTVCSFPLLTTCERSE